MRVRIRFCGKKTLVAEMEIDFPALPRPEDVIDVQAFLSKEDWAKVIEQDPDFEEDGFIKFDQEATFSKDEKGVFVWFELACSHN